MSNKRISAVAAMAVLGALSAAHASELSLSYQGFASGAVAGNIFGPEPGASRAVLAGQFLFDVEADPANVYPDDQLLAFCIDVTQALVTSGTTQFELIEASSSPLLDDSQLASIAWLYDNKAGELGNALNDAAFQLALWELRYDDSPLSLVAGPDAETFWASSFEGARETAEGWLDGLSSAALAPTYTSQAWEFYVLSPADPVANQTLLLAQRVPEPPVIGLIAAGLLLLAGTRRGPRR
jgi:hypothetical protein